MFWSASTRKVSTHVFQLVSPRLYTSWCVCHFTRIRSEWVCIGPLEGCLLVMDGRFILSSSLFLLSVFITQISPAHISRPLVHFPALLPLFNLLIVLIWIAFTRRVGWLRFTPREWKSTEVAFRELWNTSWAAHDKWLFNASPAVTSSVSPCRLILIRVHQSPAVWSHIPISQRSRHVGVRYVRINQLCVCVCGEWEV